LQPANICWLPDTNAWQLIDYGCCVREGLNVQPAFTLRFAPPELAHACAASREATIVAHRSADIWAVGVMAYEMVSGELLFPLGAAADDIRAILANERPFPHEDNPAVWSKLGRLRKVVQAMLSRDPAQRPSIADISRKLDQMAMATGATTACYRGRAEVTQVNVSATDASESGTQQSER